MYSQIMFDKKAKACYRERTVSSPNGAGKAGWKWRKMNLDPAFPAPFGEETVLSL